MTLTKTFTCDICKQPGDEDILLEVKIETARYGKDKHAHKECLIKVGLLTAEEPLVVTTNFLDVFKIEASGDTSEGPVHALKCPKCDHEFNSRKDPEDAVCPECGFTAEEPKEPHVGSPVT